MEVQSSEVCTKCGHFDAQFANIEVGGLQRSYVACPSLYIARRTFYYTHIPSFEARNNSFNNQAKTYVPQTSENKHFDEFVINSPPPQSNLLTEHLSGRHNSSHHRCPQEIPRCTRRIKYIRSHETLYSRWGLHGSALPNSGGNRISPQSIQPDFRRYHPLRRLQNHRSSAPHRRMGIRGHGFCGNSESEDWRWWVRGQPRVVRHAEG